MGVECQEELSPGKVSQLETRPQRGTDHVRNAEDRQNGALYEGSRGKVTLIYISNISPVKNLSYLITT